MIESFNQPVLERNSPSTTTLAHDSNMNIVYRSSETDFIKKVEQEKKKNLAKNNSDDITIDVDLDVEL